MDWSLKNLFVYYLAITVPFVAIFHLKDLEILSSGQFMGLLLFYVIVYRTWTDGKRLAAKNLIPNKDLWKLIFPGKSFDYFREFYLK